MDQNCPVGDFFPGVKGAPFTPGEAGFKNIVGIGNRQIGNLVFSEGASFWWNAGAGNSMDIYDIAQSAITYANASRLDPKDVTQQMAETYGMTENQMRSTIQQGKHRGSVVFARLPTESSSLYEGGESYGTAYQASKNVTPRTVMELPNAVEHHPGGAKFLSGDYRAALSKDHMLEPEMHDWMKKFAENLRDTVGPNAQLPKGTQELLDMPTMEEGNQALNNYLKSIGRDQEFPNAKIRTLRPNKEGHIRFDYDDASGQRASQITTRERIDPHLPAQKLKNMASVESSFLSAKVVSDTPVKVSARSMEKSLSRAQGTRNLLSASSEAARAVTQGVEGSGALRAAGAAMSILKSRF